MHPSSTFESDTTTASTLTVTNTNSTHDLTNETDDIETSRLLNILNWSPLEDLVTTKNPAINEENESKSKNSYNAVQISIELQKKMLR